MDLFSTLAAGVIVFATLVANAFSKIMLMLLGVIIAFLAIPQSRVAAMLGVAVISAFAGGVIIEAYASQQNWTLPFAISVSFGAGFLVYPFLTFFRKFNDLVSQDKEIVELLYKEFKRKVKKLVKK
jgi:hypothetical protein